MRFENIIQFLMALAICISLMAMEKKDPNETSKSFLQPYVENTYDSYTFKQLKKELNAITDQRSDAAKKSDQSQIQQLDEKIKTIMQCMQQKHDEIRFEKAWHIFAELTEQDDAYNNTKQLLEKFKNRLPAVRRDIIINKLQAQNQKKK